MDAGLMEVLDWVPKMATRFLRTEDTRFDDSVQEARIAAWQAWERADEERSPRDFYSRRRAQYRLMEVAGSRPTAMTGSETSGNATLHQGDPYPPDYGVFSGLHEESAESASLFRLALQEVVGQLADPRYAVVVYGKSYGMTAQEIAPLVGMSRHWVDAAWKTKIRPELIRLNVRDILSR